jgi:hypothetical protein
MRQSGLIPELFTSLLPPNLKSANPFQERTMKAFRWMLAGAFGVLLISGSPALAQGNSQGHGHGKGHDKHHDDDDQDEHSASSYEYHEQAIRAGILQAKTSFLQVLPRKIACLRGSKSN